jgi:hypothetical protein
MFESVIKMRQLVANPLWFAQVATMSVTDTGDIDVGDILAVAAFTVTDEAGALEIAMATQKVAEDVVVTGCYKDAHTFVLGILDKVIATYSTVN